ncbi:MAG: YabP/YqfC family sporulation protein [Oscillospiraceae bacterium]|nr:YabP/YqfC family sporulation protein [Oscillospiraceae bacterium]
MRRSDDKRKRNRKLSEGGDAQEAKKRGLSEIFDIPGSAIGGIAHIEMAENREAVVDGCRGVLQYDDNVVKLATGKMAVKFNGRGLQINVLTRDSAVVTGFITSVEFVL